MIELKLTDEEILILDGKCRPEIQKMVEFVKESQIISGLTSEESKFVIKIKNYAVSNGKLRLFSTNLSSCEVCKKRAGYVKFKSGRNKGRENYKKPLYLRGYDFDDSFVSIKGYSPLGSCKDCHNKLLPFIKEKLKDVRAELPESLSDRRFKKWKNKKCSSCNWTGHEGEMGDLPTLMGNGFYKGKCPKCSETNRLFTYNIKDIEGFTIVEQEIS